MKRVLVATGWVLAVLFLLVAKQVAWELEHPLFKAWVVILAFTLLSTALVRLLIARLRAS